VLAGPVRVPAQEASFRRQLGLQRSRRSVLCFPARAGWSYVKKCKAVGGQVFTSPITSAVADPAASRAPGASERVLGPEDSVSHFCSTVPL